MLITMMVRRLPAVFKFQVVSLALKEDVVDERRSHRADVSRTLLILTSAGPKSISIAFIGEQWTPPEVEAAPDWRPWHWLPGWSKWV